jgi:hypothetical protein
MLILNFSGGDVNQAVRQGILDSNFQMKKKKRSTQVGETLSKRFLDSTLIQQGKIVNLTDSTNLTHVTKRFANGNVVQQDDMFSYFQLGKKNRSTDAVESLSKKHLDGNVEQHAQTIFIVNNVNGEHSAADFQKTGKNSGKYFCYLCKFLQTLIYEEGKMHRVINFHVFQIQ